MSISSRITEMEQHIGNAYDKIEDLGIDLTDVDKNIDNIATMLEDVWNEYPKVSATDVEEASIDGTKKGRMKIDLKGNTEQIQLSGKNLFDGSKYAGQTRTHDGVTITVNENGSISMVGTSASTYSGALTITLDSMPELNGQNLVLSSTSSNSKISIYLQNPSGYSRSVTYNSEEDLKILIQSNTSQTTFNDTFNLQIEQGSTATSYEPYCGGTASPNPEFPQQIKNVVGNVNVKIENKNLVDESNVDLTYGVSTVKWNSSEKIIESSLGNPNGQFYIFKKPLEAGKTYTLIVKFKQGYFTKNGGTVNIGLYHLDSPSSWQGRIESSDLVDKDLKDKTFKVTYTATETVTGVYIFIYENARITTELKFNVLVAEGTATDYIEHQEQNYPFTLAEGQKLMLGDSLQDDGILQKRKQKIFDGTENWLAFTSQGKTAYYINLPDGTGQEAKCSHFICQVGGGFPEKNKFLYNGTTNKNIVFYTGDTENKLTEWKAYLAEQYANGTPVIVEFDLEEEEIIPYNETQQEQHNAIKEAMSYYEQTNIKSTSEEVGPIIDAEAIADMNSLLSDLETRLLTLESEV